MQYRFRYVPASNSLYFYYSIKCLLCISLSWIIFGIWYTADNQIETLLNIT